MDVSATTPLLASASPDQTRPAPHGVHGSAVGLLGEPVRQDNSTADAAPRRRHLGFYDGIAIVLGLQIGSGIFVSPSLVVRNTGSELVALLIWCLAGLLAWTCAACYIELGVRLPINGGPQEYLAHCFNNLCGFIASWACIFAVKPCSAAILALFIADYLCNALGLPQDDLDISRRSVGIFIIFLVGAVTLSGNKLSKLASKVFLACKVAGVGFIIVVGLAAGVLREISPPSIQDQVEAPPRPGICGYTDAALSAMWAYSGWETLAFVGGELKDPRRNTSLVINVSMIIVILLSILANIAYFSALSLKDILKSDSIGLTFSQRFLGHLGSVLYAIVVSLSTLGTLNVKTFTASRLTQAAADRQYLPPLLKTVPRNTIEQRILQEEMEDEKSILAFLQRPTQFGDGSIPIAGIIFNSFVAALYVLLGNLGGLITFIGIVEYSVTMFTLLGLFKLRLRDNLGPAHSEHATFRVPWLLVLVAFAATATMVSISVFRHPSSSLGFIVFVAASTAIYHLISRRLGQNRHLR